MSMGRKAKNPGAMIVANNQGKNRYGPNMTAKKPALPFAQRLLDWYDRHHRDLPWRVSPPMRARGVVADPYHVWLSEVMLQQTTVTAVKPYFAKFLALWPKVTDLAEAPSETVMAAWAGLGYYARARNLKKCAEAVASLHDGRFPDTEAGLRNLPGIGDYTAAAVAAIAFDRPAAVMDGNVERVISRFFAIGEPLPGSKPAMKAKVVEVTPLERPGDFAQGMMDLGATVCTPKRPACALCPLKEDCLALRLDGDPERFPVKAAKKEKPVRRAAAFVALSPGGRIFLQRRPEKGLLGGTVGLPTSPWVDKAIERTHLVFILNGDEVPVRVKHGFTHFDLELLGITAGIQDSAIPAQQGYFWVGAEEAAKIGIPTVFRKALKQFI